MTGRIVYTSVRGLHRRKPKLNLQLAAILVALIALTAGLIYALRYPNWHLSQIDVSGTRSLSEDAIKPVIWRETSGNYAFLIPKRSVFLLKEKSLISKLKDEFPRIQEVSLETHLPNQLLVNIVERELWAILCNDNFTPDNQDDINCVFVDSTGLAMDEAPESSGSLVVKIKTDFPDPILGEHVLKPDFAKYLQVFGEKIESVINSRVLVYELSSTLPGELRMILSDNFSLIATRRAAIEEVVNVLKTVLDEEIKEKRSDLEYIDLRFGSKVFYRFKD